MHRPGGTSLQAIRVCVRIEQATGHALSPVSFFEHDVLADLVDWLDSAQAAARG